jgi:hypothetical protein
MYQRPSIGPSTVAKAYRLLRSIMATAVDDELIGRNPCRLKGASVERPAERPVASVDEVAALADAVRSVTGQWYSWQSGVCSALVSWLA